MKVDLLKLSIPFLNICTIVFLLSCDDNVPKKEDVPELITKVTLTFTPTSGNVVNVTATDPDGEGVQGLSVNQPINLSPNRTYVLTISLINGLADANADGYDVTSEVEEEGVEHIFLFGWTSDLFSSPTGNGNIDNRIDPVNYSGAANSVDANNLPLGLTTTWTTASNSANGTFRVLLKHQPQLKSQTSGSDVGETDVDVMFDVRVQ